MSRPRSPQVLIISEDPISPEVLAGLVERNARPQVARPDALAGAAACDIGFIDARVPGAADIIKRLSKPTGGPALFLLADAADLGTADAALEAGARAVVARGTELDVVEGRFMDEPGLDKWRRNVATRVVGEAPGLRAALLRVRAVCETETTVLIGGPSGTGKELIARAIHVGSARASGPFVAVNTAALPEHLVESELFGHTRGAFTGATLPREGKIVSANGGTLFLDEIGDMPLAMQAKLLRVLQEREVTPIGADHAVAIDVRVIAATHRDLRAMVLEGKFRADLYYRLNVVSIDLPPLAARRADILPIALHTLRVQNQALKRNIRGFDASAVEALLSYDWPGNGRELANAVERAVVLRRAGMITAADLGLEQQLGRGTPARGMAALSAEDLNLRAALDNLERQLIEHALERSGGNRSEAAALLGLNHTTLVEKLKKIV